MQSTKHIISGMFLMFIYIHGNKPMFYVALLCAVLLLSYGFGELAIIGTVIAAMKINKWTDMCHIYVALYYVGSLFGVLYLGRADLALCQLVITNALRNESMNKRTVSSVVLINVALFCLDRYDRGDIVICILGPIYLCNCIADLSVMEPAKVKYSKSSGPGIYDADYIDPNRYRDRTDRFQEFSSFF